MKLSARYWTTGVSSNSKTITFRPRYPRSETTSKTSSVRSEFFGYPHFLHHQSAIFVLQLCLQNDRITLNGKRA